MSKQDNDETDGCVHLPNSNISSMEEDVLFHIALGTKSHNLPEMFGDVKFVCVGGSPRRMQNLAHFLTEALDYKVPTGMNLVNIARGKGRYAMYKVGPVLTVSHGMGIPSMSIMLHELIKLLYHAKCKGVTVFRIGTCGGLGLPPGSCVITEEALNPFLKPSYDTPVLGKNVCRPSKLDTDLTKELASCGRASDNFEVHIGKTLCTNDFYEGQARLDGAFCDYNEEDKMAFLRKAYDVGVRNIEMESLCFAAMCHHAGIKAGVVCVTLINRLKTDQITTPGETIAEWQTRPQVLVARYIRQKLALQPEPSTPGIGAKRKRPMVPQDSVDDAM